MRYFLLLAPMLLTACASNPKQYITAPVSKAEPIFKTIEIHKPRQVCEERPVVRRQAESAAPTVAGAVIGGVLGNVLGHRSSNRGVATAAGAIIGGAVGNEVGKENGTEVVHHETVCYQAGTEVEYQSVVDGYQVTYQLNGREYTTRMARDPGPTMQVVIDAPRRR